MKAFDGFKNMSPAFWAFVKLVSEQLGYTERNQGTVKVHTASAIKALCRLTNTSYEDEMIIKAEQYFEQRAALLNDIVQHNLMNAEEASIEFKRLHTIYVSDRYTCQLPLNKQKGTMRQVAFFTAIINILTEKTIRETGKHPQKKGFDDNPRGLVYIWNDKREVVGASSRRFDGVYPNIFNPSIVWEIKEYYYATTFGSRVADGVYETQLDGYEFKEILNRTGQKIEHVLFIDAYRTWWSQGKSYLCRIIDILNSGLVDEVIVGREVITRWPELLQQLL